MRDGGVRVIDRRARDERRTTLMRNASGLGQIFNARTVDRGRRGDHGDALMRGVRVKKNKKTDDVYAWCARDDAGRPNAPFLATGTMAGAIDLSFSTTACLEIFSTDYASMETEMESVGRAVPSTERFHRLVWGSGGRRARRRGWD